MCQYCRHVSGQPLRAGAPKLGGPSGGKTSHVSVLPQCQRSASESMSPKTRRTKRGNLGPSVDGPYRPPVRIPCGSLGLRGHFTFFQPTRFVLINALIVLCEPPLCMVKDFSLVFKIHSLSLTFDNLVITYLSVDFCVVFAALWAYESGVWFLSQI